MGLKGFDINVEATREMGEGVKDLFKFLTAGTQISVTDIKDVQYLGFIPFEPKTLVLEKLLKTRQQTGRQIEYYTADIDSGTQLSTWDGSSEPSTYDFSNLIEAQYPWGKFALKYAVEIFDQLQAGDVTDLLAERKQAAIGKLLRDRERCWLYGDSGSDANSCDGITNLISTNVVNVGTTITFEAIIDFCGTMLGNGCPGADTLMLAPREWAILQKTIGSSTAIQITREQAGGGGQYILSTVLGDLTVVQHPLMNGMDGTNHFALILNTQEMTQGGEAIHIRQLGPQALYDITKQDYYVSNGGSIASFSGIAMPGEKFQGAMYGLTAT